MAGFSVTDNRLVRYIKESREEMKKVTWPTRQAVIRDTMVVVGISLFVAVFFGVLDFGLSHAVEQYIRIKP